ncbi:hypothetical protein [Streptomyces sp. NBC_00040]|uniref:hypothetical protein n=1 Tax=Streptomyces sp. NBC_00040 TaxID=2903616 RepID=UPI0032449C73
MFRLWRRGGLEACGFLAGDVVGVAAPAQGPLPGCPGAAARGGQLMPDPDLTVLETDPDLWVDERHELPPVTSKGLLCHTARSHYERLKTLPALLPDLRLIACHAHPSRRSA